MFYIVNNIDSKFIYVQVTKWRKTLQNWFDCSQSRLKLVIVLFLYGVSIHYSLVEFPSPKDCQGFDFVIYFQCYLKTVNSSISLQWYQKCLGYNL